MNAKRLLLIGGGGHCLSVLDAVTGYDAIGIVEKQGGSAAAGGLDIVGADEDLPKLLEAGWTDAFITVGSVGNTALRRKLYGLVKGLGFHVPAIIDPSAAVARDAQIGEGCFVGKRAVVNTRSALGCCAIVNSGAIVEHECRVGAFAHISPGATLCGNVTVGNDAHVGAGSVVRQGIAVGNGALVGIGSAVVKDIPPGAKAYGNPCKVVG